MSPDAALRIDAWLWRTRFYKTRSGAAKAVGKGQVRVAGQRVKASRVIRVTEALQVDLPDRQLAITVMDIPGRRGPAVEALACYRIDTAVELRTQRRGEHVFGAAPAPPKRPDKQDRRKLRALKGRDAAT